MSCTLLASAIAATSLSPVLAQQVELIHKYTEGARYTTETSVHVEQVLTIAGMDLNTKTQTYITAKGSVGKRMPDGSLEVREKFESFQVELMLPGGITLVFDSSNPDAKADDPALQFLLDVYRNIARANFTTTVDKDDQILSVECDTDLLEGLSPMAAQLVEGQLDPERLKKEATQQRNRLPDGPVSPGDTWDRTQEVSLGAGQTMTFQTRYRYEGTAQKDGKTYDKISSQTLSVEYALDPDSPTPLKVTDSDLRIASSKETILFDREQGFVAQSSSSVRIVGEMTFQINGNELPGKLDLTITTEIAKRH